MEISRILGLESGNIQLKDSKIPLTMRIQNPSSTDKESGIHAWNPESTVWNPKSKTDLLDFLISLSMAAVWKSHTDNFFTETKLIQEKIQLSNKWLPISTSQQVNTTRQSNAKEKPAPHKRHQTSPRSQPPLSSTYLYLSF